MFNIWPFSTWRICPIEFKICQSKLKLLPNNKSTHSKWPKFLTLCQSGKISPNLVKRPTDFFEKRTKKILVSSAPLWCIKSTLIQIYQASNLLIISNCALKYCRNYPMALSVVMSKTFNRFSPTWLATICAQCYKTFFGEKSKKSVFPINWNNKNRPFSKKKIIQE